MNPKEEHRDRMVDLLLHELLGEEAPPDVLDRVLEAAETMPAEPLISRPVSPKVVPLKSAKRSKGPALAVAAILALFVGIGVLIHFQNVERDRSPILVELSGQVNRAKGVMGAGESLVTGPQSSAKLKYRDGTVVSLGPDSSIVLTKGLPWEKQKGLELLAGKIESEIASQGSRGPMLFLSQDARCEVLGTRLSFGIEEGGSRLEVSEGVVRFVAEHWGQEALVESGFFCETSKTGLRQGAIKSPPLPGIRSFTLMNAETDLPIREEPLRESEKISLSSLPTRQLNIRADFEGEAPDSVIIRLKRHHNNPTGLPPHASKPHQHPPFFVAGDHWADGRPEDCAAWTPPAGYYHLEAETIYSDEKKQALSQPLKISFWFVN